MFPAGCCVELQGLDSIFFLKAKEECSLNTQERGLHGDVNIIEETRQGALLERRGEVPDKRCLSAPTVLMSCNRCPEYI